MKKARTKPAESDDTSIGFWMLAQFLMFVPLVNLIAILTLSFVGGNRSRQNFFRALIAWLVIALCLHVALLLAGLSPLVLKALQDRPQLGGRVNERRHGTAATWPWSIIPSTGGDGAVQPVVASRASASLHEASASRRAFHTDRPA